MNSTFIIASPAPREPRKPRYQTKSSISHSQGQRYVGTPAALHFDRIDQYTDTRPPVRSHVDVHEQRITDKFSMEIIAAALHTCTPTSRIVVEDEQGLHVRVTRVLARQTNHTTHTTHTPVITVDKSQLHCMYTNNIQEESSSSGRYCASKDAGEHRHTPVFSEVEYRSKVACAASKSRSHLHETYFIDANASFIDHSSPLSEATQPWAESTRIDANSSRSKDIFNHAFCVPPKGRGRTANNRKILEMRSKGFDAGWHQC